MGRKHGLGISLLLGACVVTGASAAMTTVQLGQAAAKKDLAPARVLAQRRAKLTGYEASLEKALRARTPALPAVPRFAPVPVPAVASPPPAEATQTGALARSARPAGNPVAAPVAAASAPQAAPAQPVPATVTVESAAPPTGQGGDDDHGDGSDDGRGDGENDG